MRKKILTVGVGLTVAALLCASTFALFGKLVEESPVTVLVQAQDVKTAV